MPFNEETVYFARPEVGGLAHPAGTIPFHLQPGAADQELLQDTVSLSLESHETTGRLEVTVTITNTGAGHHVPTDYPGRQMILLVSADGPSGQALPLLQGPTLPAWAGEEAGLPGVVYAKVLVDLASGEKPVVSYWKQTLIDSDNRIPALAASRSTYIFQAPQDGGEIQLQVLLLFRRVFQDVALEKGWDMPDIIMVEREQNVWLAPYQTTFVPLMAR